jgi:peptide/nickel transport system substrate-binding protein
MIDNKIIPSSPIRRYLTFICISLFALAVIHCREGKDRASEEKSTITILYPLGSELGVMKTAAPAALVFLRLVSRNEKGEFEGRLARSWEHSPDYRTWTINLRTDVRWHDGIPVTAHDIKFTLDLRANPDINYELPGAYEVTVLDDHTYTITYSKWAKGTPLTGGPVYYPKHLLEELDPKEFFQWEFWTHPVGNGPYRYVRHVPQTMMEFEANPDYYRGKPRIERVVLRFGAPSLVELLSGNVDVHYYLNRMDLLKTTNDPRFSVYYYTAGVRETGIYWNHQHPPFSDHKVRRALTLAINRSELVQVLNYPESFPIFDVIFTEEQLRHAKLPEPLPYDPEGAKHLLDEAGWCDIDEDGIRERDDTQFRFTTLIARGSSWGGELAEAAAVFLQDQLQQVGVKMDILIMNHSAAKVRFQAGEFEAVLWTNELGIRGQFDLYGEGSPFGYTNPTVINLLKKAEVSMNPDEHDRIYRTLWPIFQEELPVTFLYLLVYTTVAHRRVRGLSTPYRAQPFHFMEHLWLEDEE